MLKQANQSLVIASPFLSVQACRRVTTSPHLLSVRDKLRVYLVTDLSLDNIVSGATDPEAIQLMFGAFPKFEMRFLPSLHAKVYACDDRVAVVTSANLTEGGLRCNYELGVRVSEPAAVSEIVQSVRDYGDLGNSVDTKQLSSLSEIASRLKKIRKDFDARLKAEMRNELDKSTSDALDEVLRVRTQGKSANELFERAIVYLLKSGSKRTADLHEGIRQIHPDLCDDAVDRVIDGRHYGKKWKHAVRSAQQHLRAASAIRLRGGVWELSK
ncbi:MAG TPA: phospholipase D-like domain-containing protein [Lacipirellulaceae bacterium]|nr:phospholipase D-like domain-containing protein [Lacipirellulaceae bacterium]